MSSIFIKDKTPYATLLGNIGTGKSKLCNKIGQNFAAITRKVNAFRVKNGENEMVLSDVPGLSLWAQIDYAVHIISAVEYDDISRIFLIVRYDRTDIVVREIRYTTRAWRKWIPKEHFTVIVTHCDYSFDIDYDSLKNDIDEFAGVKSVLLSGENTCGEELKAKMFDCLSITKPLKVAIPRKDIVSIFNFSPESCELLDELDDQKEQLEDLVKFLKQQYASYSDPQEKEDFLYYSQIFLVEECARMNREFIDNLDYLLIDNPIEFANLQILQNMQKIVIANYSTFAQARMAKKSFFKVQQKYTETCDYRACPHCGLIWQKVDACTNVTCGDRESSLDRMSNVFRFLRFQFTKRDGKVEITATKQEITTLHDTVNIEETSDPIIIGNRKKSLGCNKNFDWNAQTPVNMDEFFGDVELAQIDDYEQVVGRYEETIEQMKKANMYC